MHINVIDPSFRARSAQFPGWLGVETIYIIPNFYSLSYEICTKFFTLWNLLNHNATREHELSLHFTSFGKSGRKCNLYKKKIIIDLNLYNLQLNEKREKKIHLSPWKLGK